VADKPRVLFVGGPTENAADLPAGAESLFDVVKVQNPIRALAKLTHEDFDALFVSKEHFQEALRLKLFCIWPKLRVSMGKVRPKN